MSYEAEHQAEYWTLNTDNGVKIAFYGSFKSDIKQLFFFPSLLIDIVDSIIKSSAKVLTFYEKKKETARNVSVADEK